MATGELYPAGGTNYQSFQPAPNQNYVPPGNYVPVQTAPNDGSASSKLINTRMIRIRFATKCDCPLINYSRPYYQVNAISRVDDLNPQNENEVPILDAEVTKLPCLPAFCPIPKSFNYIESESKQPFGASLCNGIEKKAGFLHRYTLFPDIISSKLSDPTNISTIKCYDSRSFYRTFEYNGAACYKIGQPYVEPDCCQDCCCCCKDKEPTKEAKCCSCCKTPLKIKRTFVDIFNMSNQCVGKFVKFYDESGCCCCETKTLFFEVYFPADANEMLKLALIGQLLFLIEFGPNIFGILPGSINTDMLSLGSI